MRWGQRAGEIVRVRASCLGDARAEIAAHEVLEALELGLDDDEGEVRLGVHVARHVLDLVDLALDAVVDALKEAMGRPAVVVRDGFFHGSRGGGGGSNSSSSSSTYSRSSGDDRSAIQARVSCWRSSVSRGTACDAGSTSKRMSSMSMAARLQTPTDTGFQTRPSSKGLILSVVGSRKSD